MKYLPEWAPGAGFKVSAREWAKTVSDFYDKPFAFVKHQMVLINIFFQDDWLINDRLLGRPNRHLRLSSWRRVILMRTKRILNI